MKKVYINGLGSVSTQENCRGFLENNLVEVSKSINLAIQPAYKEIIPPNMIRRMARGVKMGIYASQKALDEANISVPDAIISGTGMGCLIDSEKFLKNIVDNKESYLTPTSFIQSTQNTVGSQIALRLQCKGFNFTYVNRRVSFESALMDALLQIKNNELENALVGGVDEIDNYTLSLLQLIGNVNIDGQNPLPKAVNYGEGSTFFTLANSNTETTYSELKDVIIQNILEEAELTSFVEDFLFRNQLQKKDIDALVLGTNYTDNDLEYYSVLKSNVPTASIVEYKNFTGEYETASAFGFLLANEILKNQKIPNQLNSNKLDKKEYKNILIYNQFDGTDHSLILLSRC